MSGEELFAIAMKRAGLQMGAEVKPPEAKENMTAKLGEPINAECPLKPGRAIDPTLKALNEKGETIGFCCRSCLNRFKASLPEPQSTVAKSTTPKFGSPINSTCPIKPGRPVDPSLLAFNDDGDTVAFCCRSCVNKFKQQQMETPGAAQKASTAPSHDYGNYVKDRNSVRASEVGSPPAGHFIREFGASSRDQIEGSHKQASVTQVLNLLNGYVEKSLLKNDKVRIVETIKKGKTVDSKIENAFMAILNREPTSSELRNFKDAIRSSNHPEKDLVWVLVNSHEFLFVQ